MSLVDDFKRDGFCLLANAISHTDLEQVQSAADVVARDQPKQAAGLRGLLAKSATISTLADTILRDIAARLLEQPSHRLRAVRAILFDKNPKANWYVTWHQDLAIPVIARHEVPGYGPWSIKDGVPHVQPPIAVLQSMVSLRLHLDDCFASNGPVLFLPGSHIAGLLDAAQIAKWRACVSPVSGIAARGDIIAMKPLVLHSSAEAESPAQRRVLHVEFANVDVPLPPPLEWGRA